MSTTMAQNSPVIMGSLEKNIFEHISLMADEQVQMEMQEKIMQVGQLQQMMQNPEAQQNPELKQEMDRLVMEIESRKAVLISEMTEEFVKEQNKIMGDLGNDPIAKLRARELDIKAQDNLRKQKEDDARLNLDKMKAMMNQSYQQEKMDQTEDLADLELKLH